MEALADAYRPSWRESRWLLSAALSVTHGLRVRRRSALRRGRHGPTLLLDDRHDPNAAAGLLVTDIPLGLDGSAPVATRSSNGSSSTASMPRLSGSELPRPVMKRATICVNR